MTAAEKPAAKWVTTSEAKRLLQMNTPMFVRRMKQHNFKVSRNPRDHRVRYVDINEIKAALDIEVLPE